MMSETINQLTDTFVESGLYIHIPFCRKKCLYCDFFSGGTKLADWNVYPDAVLNELRERVCELKSVPSTIYIGGGTPSLIPLDIFPRFIREIESVVGRKDPWREFTLEVNPEDVTPEACRIWARCGVNRISMGIQSLDDGELRLIGRAHDSRQALEALTVLQHFFENVTIDLIFGLPGQTMDSWKKTVDTVLRCRPQHISAYSLMFEEGTPITVLRDQGRLSFPEEEECVAMWLWLKSALDSSGYRQYELSNYSLPGFESCHNSRYWLGNPYLGLGPSAHSYDGDRIRRSNPNDISGYIRRFSSGSMGLKSEAGKDLNTHGSSFYIEEKLTDEELMEEKLMLSLRMARGLDLEAFGRSFGTELKERLLANVGGYLENSELILDGGFLSLSDRGKMLADDIILNICP